jgi:hypothetical protein
MPVSFFLARSVTVSVVVLALIGLKVMAKEAEGVIFEEF